MVYWSLVPFRTKPGTTTRKTIVKISIRVFFLIRPTCKTDSVLSKLFSLRYCSIRRTTLKQKRIFVMTKRLLNHKLAQAVGDNTETRKLMPIPFFEQHHSYKRTVWIVYTCHVLNLMVNYVISYSVDSISTAMILSTLRLCCGATVACIVAVYCMNYFN